MAANYRNVTINKSSLSNFVFMWFAFVRIEYHGLLKKTGRKF